MYRLRGNTFIALLLRAGVQELSEKPQWGDNNNGITRPNLFADLLKMTQPEYNPPKIKSLSSLFSQYLKGDKPFSPMYFAFDTAAYRYGLSSRVKSEYATVLSEMDSFYRKYLRTSQFDRNLLVGGLVDAILADDSFNGVFETGINSVDKLELDRQNCFILQPFLISVWNNILINHPDTSEGAETYMDWTEETGLNKPRQTITDIGAERAKKITVSDQLPEESTSDTATEKTEDDNDIGEEQNKEEHSGPDIIEDDIEQNGYQSHHQTIMINNGSGPQIKEYYGNIVINIK